MQEQEQEQEQEQCKQVILFYFVLFCFILFCFVFDYNQEIAGSQGTSRWFIIHICKQNIVLVVC
jgi:hypothetical protein